MGVNVKYRKALRHKFFFDNAPPFKKLAGSV